MYKICLYAYLFGEYKVGIGGHGGSVGDEVGDRLHDVPGVLPPGQASQDTELN